MKLDKQWWFQMTDHNTCVNTSPTTTLCTCQAQQNLAKTGCYHHRQPFFSKYWKLRSQNTWACTIRLHSCTIVTSMHPCQWEVSNCKPDIKTDNRGQPANWLYYPATSCHYSTQPWGTEYTDGSEVALLSWTICSQKNIFVFLIDWGLTVRF